MPAIRQETDACQMIGCFNPHDSNRWVSDRMDRPICDPCFQAHKTRAPWILKDQARNEDHLVTLSWLPDECLDMIITSPPYDDIITQYEHEIDVSALIDELERTLKPGGVVAWNTKDRVIDGCETFTSIRTAELFHFRGWNVRTLYYEKTGFSKPSTAFYHDVLEYVFIFSKGKPKTFNPLKDRPNKERRKKNASLSIHTLNEKNGRPPGKKRTVEYGPTGLRTVIWKYVQNHEDKWSKMHPAPMPLALARDLMLSWSNPGDLVYDPMGGSGTVGKAAIQLGRHYLLSELDEKHCSKIILPRLEHAASQGQLFPAEELEKPEQLELINKGARCTDHEKKI
jgi:site-specific DNA-methyltransferase (adenine-specific)